MGSRSKPGAWGVQGNNKQASSGGIFCMSLSLSGIGRIEGDMGKALHVAARADAVSLTAAAASIARVHGVHGLFAVVILLLHHYV